MLSAIQYRTFCFLVCSQKLTIGISRTIILPRVLCGCKTWSLILREEHRLRMFGNRVLRRIFGQKRDEGTGRWRNPYNEELHNLCFSPSIIRIIKLKK
jgi:hypothetical protein